MSETHIRFNASGATDTGRVRAGNEDAFVICDARTGALAPESSYGVDLAEQSVLLALSDGMGGANAGEVASAMTLEALRRHLAERISDTDPVDALVTAIQYANEAVAAASHAPGQDGMGATLVAVLLTGSDAYVATVGDSRVYLLRAGRLARLTKDQTLLQWMRERGAAPNAATFPFSNVILQAVGRARSLLVPVSRLTLRRGDRLLLCSDGLTNEVPDEDLLAFLSLEVSQEVLCAKLIRAANDHGGNDNVTVLVSGVEGAGLDGAKESEPLSATLEYFDPNARSTARPDAK